jgi:hypothetical protein
LTCGNNDGSLRFDTRRMGMRQTGMSDEKQQLHQEHADWSAEHAAWEGDLANWRREQQDALAVLTQLRDALARHADDLEAHAASIAEHEGLIEAHEDRLASEDSEQHGVLDRLLEHRHDREFVSHGAQRERHAELGARHAALAEALTALRRLYRLL